MARNLVAFLACGLPLSAAFFHSAPLLAVPAHSQCFSQRAPAAAGRRFLGLRGARAELPGLESVPFFQLQTDSGPVPDLPEDWQKGGVYACFNKSVPIILFCCRRLILIRSCHSRDPGETRFCSAPMLMRPGFVPLQFW